MPTFIETSGVGGGYCLILCDQIYQRSLGCCDGRGHAEQLGTVRQTEVLAER